MYENIVVPLDGSELAEGILPFVEQIAGLAVFFGVHAFTTMRTQRAAMVARLGEGPYKIVYSVLSLKRPQIHGLSFVAFTFGCGAACLVPLLVWELLARPVMQLNLNNLLSLIYVAVFPSTLAYLCFNRGVQLIGANRTAPFFHVVPVFGTVLSIIFLGEHPQLFHFIGFGFLVGCHIWVSKPARRIHFFAIICIGFQGSCGSAFLAT